VKGRTWRPIHAMFGYINSTANILTAGSDAIGRRGRFRTRTTTHHTGYVSGRSRTHSERANGFVFKKLCGLVSVISQDKGFLQNAQTGCGAHPASSILLPGVKNEWSYTSTPPICLHGLDREDFTCFNHKMSS
jgi:hypothetical protein